jgi:signal transduction histidine kinase
LIQFLWWAWLLIDQSAELAQFSVEDSSKSYTNRRIMMVLGEGAVFVLILLLGFRKLKNSIEREVVLAHTQRNFLLSVTHELNTPLATIKLLLQTLKRPNVSSDKKEEITSKAINETDRLKKLVDNILTSARIEENKLILHPETQNIFRLIHPIIHTYQERYGKDKINLKGDESCTASVDGLAVSSILNNLIENAVKYSDSHEKIEISVESNSNNATQIVVKDYGIGISEKDRTEVFEKFYRVQEEATRSTKGTGLGLFIVKNLVESQGGRVSCTPNHPKGTKFIIEFNTAS